MPKEFETFRLKCPKCEANLDASSDQFFCAYCGTGLMAVRKGGRTILKRLQKRIPELSFEDYFRKSEDGLFVKQFPPVSAFSTVKVGERAFKITLRGFNKKPSIRIVDCLQPRVSFPDVERGVTRLTTSCPFGTIAVEADGFGGGSKKERRMR
jgi:hypothetical protein